jgi:hypothetical protein
MARVSIDDLDDDETRESPHLSTFLHKEHYVVVDYVDELESFCMFFPALNTSADERVAEPMLIIGPDPRDARHIYDLVKERARTTSDPIQLFLDAQIFIAAEIERQSASDNVFAIIEDLPN